tara:strand:- start:94125 stop:95276 length:1152 start_codon:yes stop_codon:yes gene_type:complete
LFLPIFRRLAEYGWELHVLQFTWGDSQRLQQSRQACAEAGVPYRSVCVWRRPVSLGSLATAVKGARDIRRAVREWNIDVVMPRSTLPVLSCMRALSGKKLPMVFDADGLPLDERVDFGGMTSTGLAYRLMRDIEAQGVRRADVVLTRTEKAAEILLARAGAGTSRECFHKVGNGRDAAKFFPIDQLNRGRVRERLGVSSQVPLLAYAGSLGGKYQLSEMLELFSAVLRRRPDARLLVLTGSPEFVARGIEDFPEASSSVITLTVGSGEVCEYLASADVGLALIKPSFSMQAAAAIKVGEYLLCGLPVIATDGVGDTSSITPQVGFALNETNKDVLEEAAIWFTDNVLPKRELFRARCRKVGVEHHSLESSVVSYLQALQGLSS